MIYFSSWSTDFDEHQTTSYRKKPTSDDQQPWTELIKYLVEFLWASLRKVNQKMCTHSQTTQARHTHSHNSPRYVSLYCDDDFLFCSLLDVPVDRFPPFMAGWLWDFVYRAVVAALGWDDWLVSVLAPRDNTKRTTILDIRLTWLTIKNEIVSAKWNGIINCEWCQENLSNYVETSN